MSPKFIPSYHQWLKAKPYQSAGEASLESLGQQGDQNSQS